jgi:hypothetical protein
VHVSAISVCTYGPTKLRDNVIMTWWRHALSRTGSLVGPNVLANINYSELQVHALNTKIPYWLTGFIIDHNMTCISCLLTLYIYIVKAVII